MSSVTSNEAKLHIERIPLVEGGGDFDKAVVYYNMGFAYSSKNDYANAAKSFAKALASQALPGQQQEQLMYNLGQLYIVAVFKAHHPRA